MTLSPPLLTPSDADEIDRLLAVVAGIGLPSPDLPGWRSLTSEAYSDGVRELARLLGEVRTALQSARAAA